MSSAKPKQQRNRRLRKVSRRGAAREGHLTEAERAERTGLERAIVQNDRAAIAALREVRDRRLYRDDYPNFDAYVAQRWGKTRQWVTQQINWLRIVELLEQSGKDPYQKITVDDAQSLATLDDNPETMIRAIEQANEEAQQDGKHRNKLMLQAAVYRELEYATMRHRDDIPKDLTFEEFKVLRKLSGPALLQPDLVAMASKTAEANGRPLADCLCDVCDADRHVPTDEQLLAVARGDALRALVERLSALEKQWQGLRGEQTDEPMTDEQRDDDEPELVAIKIPEEAQDDYGMFPYDDEYCGERDFLAADDEGPAMSLLAAIVEQTRRLEDRLQGLEGGAEFPATYLAMVDDLTAALARIKAIMTVGQP